MQPQYVAPLNTYDYGDSNEWLSFSSPEMIDDISVSPPQHLQEQPTTTASSLSTLQLKRRELENMPEDSAILNRFFKPTKYWSRQCPLENENNCLQEYYSALIADRNNALLKQLQHKQNLGNVANTATYNHNDINDDDIVLLLTAEQNLVKFLSWALAELYPYGKFANRTDTPGAEFYHPGMYMWKKLNLSGRIEPPLLVDEPKYIITRREYDPNDDNEDIDYKRGLNYGGDPFIPPRGRKHNLPDLDALLHRYETFVPNRGRRDKIKDIFKYDDLFYPNRGKRQMISTATVAANDNGDIDERNGNDEVDDDNDIKDIAKSQYYYNNINEINKNSNNNNNNNLNEQHEMQHPLLSNELAEYVENLMAKMQRKLQQTTQLQQQLQDNDNNDEDDEKLANTFDEMSNKNEPTTRMSTTFQQAPPAAVAATSSPSASLSQLQKRFKSTINILHNHKQQQHQHLPNHYNARRQWLKRYTTTASATKPTNNIFDRPMPIIRSPTLATNRLQTTLRSMSPLQQLTQLYQQHQPQQQQQHQLSDLSPPHIIKQANKFMWQQQQQQQKSLAQQFDPLSWHKLQLLLQQQQYHHHHQPSLLTMRHPRLTALQHLPAIQQQQQQLATPQETQLTYSNDQLDNSITNDLDNFYNKDMD
ncbi:natalisin isoform 1-T1 [Cochliomyia hominivorax]